jgi:hypothetical protein
MSRCGWAESSGSSEAFLFSICIALNPADTDKGVGARVQSSIRSIRLHSWRGRSKRRQRKEDDNHPQFYGLF